MRPVAHDVTAGRYVLGPGACPIRSCEFDQVATARSREAASADVRCRRKSASDVHVVARHSDRRVARASTDLDHPRRHGAGAAAAHIKRSNKRVVAGAGGRRGQRAAGREQVDGGAREEARNVGDLIDGIDARDQDIRLGSITISSYPYPYP